jgi:hypothetical protein
VEVDENRVNFLRELSAYYVQTRYPEEIAGLVSRVKQQESHRILEQTREVVLWLSEIP